MRTKRAVILLAVLLALAPASASAAFPGRNGAIAYGYHSDPIPGDGEVARGSWSVRIWVGPRANQRVLGGCDEQSDPACVAQRRSAPAFAPDGHRVAVSIDGALRIIDLTGNRTRQPAQEVPVTGRGDVDPAFSPDGRRLAFISETDSGSGDLWTRDLRSGQAHLVIANAADPAWSTRGWIAYTGRYGIYRIRPDGDGRRLVVPHARAGTWSPDGRRLAFTSTSHVNSGIYLSDGQGRNRRQLPGAVAHKPVSDLAWSPDGRRLAVGGESLVILDLNGKLRRSLFTPDSTELALLTDWQPLPRSG